jgi:hypothetical protein
MMQRDAFRRLEPTEEEPMVAAGSEPIRINVFTSDKCLFCCDALNVAKSAAKRLTYLLNHVKVVETDIGREPDLVEKLDIVALPMIMVGKSRLIGLPTPQDVERLVHKSLFAEDEV